MRHALSSSVAIFLAFAPATVFAADISEQGAGEILSKLTYYLPKSVADSGFIKVTPATNRYEMSVDLSPFLAKIDPKELTISGLKPFVSYITPQDDGLWKFETNNDVNITGQFSSKDEKGTFSYVTEKFVYEGMFDPTISLFQSGNFTAENISLNSTTGASSVQFRADHYSGDARIENANNGVADFVSNGSATNITEVIQDATSGGPVQVKFGSFDSRSQIDKLSFGAVRDLIVFVLDAAKEKRDKLSHEEAEKLRGILRANVPFTDNLASELHMRDMQVFAQGLSFSLSDLNYALSFSGIKRDARVAFQVGLENPVIPAGLLPPGIEQAVPRTASMGIAMTGLNLEGAANYFLDHADLTFQSKDALKPEEQAEIAKILLPENVLKYEFSNVVLKSDIYDVAANGKITQSVDNPSSASADVTVVAHDFDKTVKFLQDNASKVPDFQQAAFFALLAKGFAKTDVDGSLVWNVKVAPGGAVTINGQPMKM